MLLTSQTQIWLNKSLLNLKRMPGQEIYFTFINGLLDQADQGNVVLDEFNTRPTQRSLISLVEDLTVCLELDEELVILGLILARRAVNWGLKVTKECAYKLVTISFILADKFFFEEHNSLETYSIITAIPIRQLISLEASLLQFLDYSVMPNEEQIQSFSKNEPLFPSDQLASMTQLMTE